MSVYHNQNPLSSGIDPNNALPKYYQLAGILRQRIENGEWQAHEPISSERVLEEQFNLSRPTIRQAIELLIRMGFLYRQHGLGTFVSPPKLQKGILELTSFSEDMRSRGLEPGQVLMDFGETALPEKAARLLEISDPKRKALRIKRLRLGSGDPIGIQDSYLLLEAGQTITREELEKQGSIYVILQNKFGIFPAEADESLEVTLASQEEAELLHVAAGSPLLLNERVLWDQNRRAVEYVKILYRGDRYKYTVHLKRKIG